MRRRLVLTGGPGAGKTAVLELVRQHFCRHVRVLPEAASILFTGGFPRGVSTAGRQSAQRAIFWVQRELEASADADGNSAIVLCDRGTVDGFAYWPGPTNFWAALELDREHELSRYDTVVHLRTPTASGGYNHRNPVRLETAAEAGLVDEWIAQAWEGHPRRFTIDNSADFLSKARRTLELLRAELPECCREKKGTARFQQVVATLAVLLEGGS